MAGYLTDDDYVDQGICRFFLMSECFTGNRCKFEHRRDLVGKKMLWVCLPYLGNKCVYKDKCRFDHPARVKGLFLLAKICCNYRGDKEGGMCSDDHCSFLHFTKSEHRSYVRDKVIPERFRDHRFVGHNRPQRDDSGLVQYSSDEENFDGDTRRNNDDTRRNNDNFRADARSQERNERSRNQRERSRSPLCSTSSQSRREESPPGDHEKRIKKLKKVAKDLRNELNDLWKDNKLLQRQLDDHKEFHQRDQELITDLMRSRDKLEEEVNSLSSMKTQLSTQITDLFGDNKIVVEENQRLRRLLQDAQSFQGSQTRQSTTTHSQAPVVQPNSDQFRSSHNSSSYQQSSWN